MTCPFCGADEEWPSSPCASFTRYECGSEYRDGDTYQSDECESNERIEELEHRLKQLEDKINAG